MVIDLVTLWTMSLAVNCVDHLLTKSRCTSTPAKYSKELRNVYITFCFLRHSLLVKIVLEALGYLQEFKVYVISMKPPCYMSSVIQLLYKLLETVV